MAGLIDLLFPPSCVACARVLPTDAAFCEDCDAAVERVPPVHCARCAEPGDFEGRTCPRCRQRSPAFERAYAPFVHAGSIARAIHQFKYEDHPELARPLAQLLWEEARTFLSTAPSAIAAIPLHRSRFLERKYDQAALLASELARLIQKPFLPDLLTRTRKTERQVGLSEEARRSNVATAFSAQGPVPASVLLVDDVLTTSATAAAAATALVHAGVARIQILTLARAHSGA